MTQRLTYFLLVHRDIKPSNIFILESSANGTAAAIPHRLVLGDFGLSLPLENGLFTNSITPDLFTANGKSAVTHDVLPFGSLGWMAPEMCSPSQKPLVRSW